MEEEHPRKAAISGEVSASAWPCRELWSVNYTIYPTENLWITQELAQPKGKGVSLLLLNQSVISRAVEGRECRVLSSQPLSVLCVCVCTWVGEEWYKLKVKPLKEVSRSQMLALRSNCTQKPGKVHRTSERSLRAAGWNMNTCNINQENFTDPRLCWLCLFIIGVGQ